MAMTKRQKAMARHRKAMMAQLRQDQHRHVRERKAKPEDPRKTALDARKRHIGKPKGDLSLPMYSHPCGIAIDSLADSLSEALALWDVFDRIDRSDAAYCGRCVGVRRFAKTAKIELLPERMETSADAPPADLRDDDERHRAAQNAWARWIAILSRLDAPQRKAITGTMRGLLDAVRDDEVTTAGAHMVSGLRRISEMERSRGNRAQVLDAA